MGGKAKRASPIAFLASVRLDRIKGIDQTAFAALEFDTSSYILVCWGPGGGRKINHLRRLGLDIRGQRHRYM